MKRIKRKILSIFLTTVMLLTLAVPMAASAVTDDKVEMTIHVI